MAGSNPAIPTRSTGHEHGRDVVAERPVEVDERLAALDRTEADG